MLIRKTITLTELIIAISLMGVVILGVTSFDAGSRQFLKASERKTQVVNEATLIIDRISKDALIAIGDAVNPAITVTNQSPAEPCIVAIVPDVNNDGVRDAADVNATITYTRVGNQITRQVGAATPEVLSNRAVSFSADAPVANSINVTLVLMFDPARAQDTFENPRVTVQGNIEAPAWSVN